jgi:hypothetical protein
MDGNCAAARWADPTQRLLLHTFRPAALLPVAELRLAVDRGGECALRLAVLEDRAGGRGKFSSGAMPDRGALCAGIASSNQACAWCRSPRPR